MQCPRCLNEDEKYFYKGSKGYYCRKCISYGRVLLDDEIEPFYYQVKDDLDADYILRFKLTKAQKEKSDKCAELSEKENVLIWAACGAGKTEIVMESIKRALKNKKTVGYAIPRRQVVLEISERLKKAFKGLKVVAVCGGHSQDTEGDLVVCTTHQLYRYHQRFDLLILDEPDAFPYKGNDVLQGIVKTSCKGHMIALSATPDEKLKEFKTLTLFKRPHGFPLSVPKVEFYPLTLLRYRLINYLKGKENILIFVPSIIVAKQLSKLLKVPCFTSQTEDKDILVDKFRNKELKFLVCTTVLERGVTFSNVKIIVFQADHRVFDKASLIQIAGRAGRDPKYPTGEVLFLCEKKSKDVINCIKDIQMMNA